MSQTVNRRIQYNVEVDWKALPAHTDTLEGISDDVVSLRFRREKRSHRGISRLKELRQLVAFCVNQECLEELSQLPQIEMLYLSQLSATDLGCLSKCRSLRHLVIKGGTKVSSLSWLEGLPPLQSLLLEHLKLINDIAAVKAIPSLTAFGFEGSMWTTQPVESFQPITQLPNLEALFLTNCRPKSDGLRPLGQIRPLQYLEIAGFFPDAEFLALRQDNPALQCQWFEQIDKYGSIKAAIKGRTGG
jgi:Leucine-rich repeat (LRR) protein